MRGAPPPTKVIGVTFTLTPCSAESVTDTHVQLTGIALTEFITKRTGVRREDVTVDSITVNDLDEESFKIFRREALRSRRMTQEELDISNDELLSKLGLMKNGKLKRSAVLLFYHDPGIVQVGSYIKIGRFGEGADLQYHDDLEGSLIKNADQVIDLIYLKYLKAKVEYIHDRRVETYPFAREAIREAVYNAIAHTCYMYGVPIQIRIEDEQLIISNQCIFPEGWTVETLLEPMIPSPIIRILQMFSTGQGILSIGAEELKRYLMNARPWVLSNRTMNFLDMVFVSFSRHLRVLL